ncbi:MAG TPA: hypothetical protein VN039_09930 [Nitrospira sp.]|nr:hypothetical protein [Nitrospira sp.]
MATLGELREQVARAQRNATAKIGRLKNEGIIVAGSDKDVRVTRDRLNRYNRGQLLSQLAKVNTFNARSTKFVAGIEGTPISLAVASAHAQAERLITQRANRQYAGVRETPLPSGNTIGFVEEVVRGDKRGSMKGNHRPLEPVHRPASNFTSEKAMKAVTRKLNRQLSTTRHRGEIKKQAERVEEALKAFGNDKLSQAFKQLTPYQTDILLNYTHSQSSFFDKYLEMMLALRGKEGRIINENAEDESFEWLNWALGLPKQAPTNPKK